MASTEPEEGLRRVAALCRWIGLGLMLLHSLGICWPWWKAMGLFPGSGQSLLELLRRSGLFHPWWKLRPWALGFVMLSVLGSPGTFDGRPFHWRDLGLLAAGLGLFKLSDVWVPLLALDPCAVAPRWLLASWLGLLLSLAASLRLRRSLGIAPPGRNSVFNWDQECFPQQTRRVQTPDSLHFRIRFRFAGRRQLGWVNVLNPCRGLLVMGSPGSGKTHSVIRQAILQLVRKGYCMCVYDFKFDDLSRLTYNAWRCDAWRYRRRPRFCVLDFEQLSLSQRCNPLEPESLMDLSDALESARSILLGLNREWIRRQGDFFVESPINFLAALIWFLRCYRDGSCCSLPHVLELLQLDYTQLFPLLRTEPELLGLLSPFLSAYENQVLEQLEGQIASARIAMARLGSPQLYYLLSGQDFSLDINDPQDPKILCLGNHPLKSQVYGAVLGLLVGRMLRQINRKGRLPCALVFDELPTLYLQHMDQVLATGRSNRLACILGVQDLSQLRRDYGREQAEVLVQLCANVISGQVGGDSARLLSERLGRILQDRRGFSVNSRDVSRSLNRQLDSALPASRLQAMRAGEFAGSVTDEPAHPLRYKAFHGQFLPEPEARWLGRSREFALPQGPPVGPAELRASVSRIRADIRELLQLRLQTGELRRHPQAGAPV